MKTETEIPVEKRILQLLRHLGVEQAHFAARSLGDLTSLAAHQPEMFASLTLICPATPSRETITPLAARLLVFLGDVAGFDDLGQFVESLSEATVGVLQNYVSWSDLVARHADEIQTGMLPFLQVNTPDALPDMPLTDGERGEIAGITYQIAGSGPPLVLLPLGLVPSQWEPIMPALTSNFCTITLGGAELGMAALLEKRATAAGYLGMVRSLLQEAHLQPGDSVLEVGCGTGALNRWLYRHTGGKNPITGVDFNRYLLREAENLARLEGLAEMVGFAEDNAEELSFPDDSFDVTLSVTMMEEVHADKALAEMIRVTRPGGRVAVIVRAMDVPFNINMPLADKLKAKLEDPREWVHAGPDGCADASLYRRFQATLLTDVKMYPHLAAFTGPWIEFLQSSIMSMLDPAEKAQWLAARTQTEAEGTFIFSYPHHCAVGTVPL